MCVYTVYVYTTCTHAIHTYNSILCVHILYIHTYNSILCVHILYIRTYNSILCVHILYIRITVYYVYTYYTFKSYIRGGAHVHMYIIRSCYPLIRTYVYGETRICTVVFFDRSGVV